MTPQEKAVELFKKLYQPIFDIDNGSNVLKDSERYEASKECALIAVDEILEQIGILGCYENFGRLAQRAAYWLEVKKEIEKL